MRKGEQVREVHRSLEATSAGDSQWALTKAFNRYILEWRNNTVLVLGFSGAGKTSLLSYLFGLDLDESEEDQQTTAVNKYILKVGKAMFLAADTPGHQSLREILEAELDALVRGEYQGIINVVAYGYNESRHHKDLSQEEARCGPLLEAGDVNPQYLAAELGYEMEYLNNWVKLIGTEAALRWVITVPNKADLWHEKHPEAVTYYEGDGEYGRTIRNNIGHISHDVCPLICTLGGFHGKKTNQDAGWDERREQMKNKLLDTLHAKMTA